MTEIEKNLIYEFKQHWYEFYPNTSLDLFDRKILEFIQDTDSIAQACFMASEYLLQY